ncbi:uncharacterized protein PFL1_02841 [Pseudozyma flocculosa PF-1]|uniref:type I protein arginine methyltransferase n=2 Tax=Pseudozyma flocculosa TaxID=84751 RepID=A0A5C3F0Z2_9BASI|nr:uncharacterized protein PFL1_02841 [Pseudozyma flocculosa PF-1]EPQ29622.1 hypothetical protein PFL1_02841 [Pseudozyma flocculosa PF-1]SPO38184.1 related to HMT1 - hnRNP arginine N-methyltransferase [Pseudozyma flocculosa]
MAPTSRAPAANAPAPAVEGQQQPTTDTAAAAEIYDDKDEAYFGYYALLSHQAQMLQDSVRTAVYHQAINHHAAQCFQDKLVMDVGAGNGILSFFSAQAGARKVYAVEASNMVDYLHKVLRAAGGSAGGSDKANGRKQPQRRSQQQVGGDNDDDDDGDDDEQDDEGYSLGGPSTSTSTAAAAAATGSRPPRNAFLADTLVPVHSKVEDVTPDHLEGNQQVDTIVSECLGVLLVHERMCESFIDARDRFLKPGGSVFPSAGTICLAPFEDKALWDDTANKARWWRNSDFYGVDITPFAPAAFKETFSSPIVGVFQPQCLLSVSSDFVIDFATISKSELQDFTMPLEWTFVQPAIVHGLGGWFDLHFNSQSSATASSASMSSSSSSSSNDAAAAASHAANASSTTLGQIQLPATDADRDGDATMQDHASSKPATTASALSGSAPDFQPALELSSSAVDVETIRAAAASASSASSTAVPLPPLATTTASGGQFMSTSPYATPTHWQQVRFLFSDPVAVNKGQKLVGSIRCRVNDSRSYTMTGRFDILRTDGTADPLLQRKGAWRLDRQTYSWS